MDNVAFDVIVKEVEGYIENDTTRLWAKDAPQTDSNSADSSLAATSLGSSTSMANWRSRSAKHRRTASETDWLK